MVNRKVNGAIKRKTNRTREKEDEILKNVIKVLSESPSPKSTQEIADELNTSWHPIQTRCLSLQILGKVTGFRIGRMNLWQIKK